MPGGSDTWASLETIIVNVCNFCVPGNIGSLLGTHNCDPGYIANLLSVTVGAFGDAAAMPRTSDWLHESTAGMFACITGIVFLGSLVA